MDLKEQTGNHHRHPWELSRADMALRLLGGGSRTARYADIGAGDLYFARQLLNLTDAAVYAVDVHYGVPTTEGRLNVCTSLEQVPAGSIDYAVLMDVLEHVEDDIALVQATRDVLTKDGRVLVTVPAHQFLWSQQDRFLHHYRRYSRAALCLSLQRGGLDVVEAFYFYAIPFAARSVSVVLEKAGLGGPKGGEIGTWPFGVQHPITRMMRGLLNADFRVSRLVANTPVAGVGLSICALCRQKSA